MADDDIAGPDATPWDEPPTTTTDGVAAAPVSAMPEHPCEPATDGGMPLPDKAADDDDWIAQIGSRGVSLDLDWDDDEDNGESTDPIGDTGVAGADAVDVAACADDDDGGGRARSYRPLIIAAAVFVAILMVAALVFALHAHQTAGDGRRREAQCAQYAQQLAQWDASVARAKRLRLNAGSSPERTCPADTEAHTSRLRSRTNSLDKRISEQIATQWEAMRTQAARAVKDWPLAGKDTLSALKAYEGLPVGTLDALQSRQDTLRGLRAKAQQEDAANRAKQEAERKNRRRNARKRRRRRNRKPRRSDAGRRRPVRPRRKRKRRRRARSTRRPPHPSTRRSTHPSTRPHNQPNPHNPRNRRNRRNRPHRTATRAPKCEHKRVGRQQVAADPQDPWRGLLADGHQHLAPLQTRPIVFVVVVVALGEQDGFERVPHPQVDRPVGP
ncbi:protein TolA [Bifidobacterium sp. GSD1FS]|uniref:Protein TolA n=1 Tax=Bifidobacterium canis TaxID=2610880 RepID=A0A7K1J6V6_9BIFI|nr:protein TolA [Bifidobacterium canis]